MTNPIVGYPTATTAFVLSGGAYQPAYPRENMQQDDLDQVARTVDLLATSAFFYGVSAIPVDIGLVGLFGLNATIAASLRLRFWTDPTMAAPPILDTGSIPVFPYSRMADPHWVYWDGNNYSIRAFRIDLVDATNLAGFLDIGRLELAFAVETGFGMNQGAQRGRLLRTGFNQTPGGMKYFRPLSSPRVLKATFDADDPEMADFYLEMLRIYDLYTPFIIMPNPDDRLRWNQSNMLARFTQQSPMATWVAATRGQIALEFEQVL